MENKSDNSMSAKREMEIKVRREFQQELDNATEKERERYYQLLNAARRNRFDKEKPGLVSISIEERLKFIQLAKSEEDIEALIKPSTIQNVDPIKMREDWDNATKANKGRPPIGGAVDD